MPRLIDADSLMRDIEQYHLSDGKFQHWVEVQPTIDTEPVRHGKWREYPIADGMNQCSECGVLRFGESNYCPNCGCRMDEE